MQTTEIKSEFKPCPCCGSEAYEVVSPEPMLNRGTHMVSCAKHGCKVVIGKSHEDAVNLWNEPRFSQAHL